MTEAGPQRPPGLAGSLARLARTALGVLRTRLEILATEIEEERIRFAGLALVVAAIAFCVQMAVLLFVILMVVLLWESHRVVTLGTLSGAFLVCGVVLYFWLRRRLRTRPRMFASTLGELGKDDERLGRGGGRG
ncbi:MAG: phage holin family protein [Burkholderiales bacterium]